MKTLAQKLLEARKQDIAVRTAFIEKEIRGQKFEMEVESRAVSIDQEAKTVIFVMSTAAIDRHGDIIDQDTWNLEHFDKNPAFFLQHRADEFPLGKWEDRWFEADPDIPGSKRLMGKALFRVKYPDAERAFDHVVEGDLNMVSVGFIPHRIEYDENTDAFILYDCELLECSLVGIGSQRHALVSGKEKENTAATVKDKLIEGANILEEVINSDTQSKAIAHVKARAMIHQAIRRL